MSDEVDRPQIPPPPLEEAEAERRLSLNRRDVAALVAKADHRFRAGDHRSAAAFYAFAAKQGGLDSSDAELARAARRTHDMRDWLADHFRYYIVQSVEGAGFPMSDWPPRFRKAIAILLGDRQRDLVYEEFPQLPNLFFYPDLPYVDFADLTLFPWQAPLEAAFGEIRGEAEALLADTDDFRPYVSRTTDRPQGDVHGLLENADWSSLYLWNNGGPVEDVVARCPKTFGAVTEHVPLCRIGRMAPAILFSLLKPGAHIPPHTGMLNVRYICHLPLVVPPQCQLRVGGRTAQWQEGRMLAFDDTVEHEAFNRSDRDRLVLIFDVWNPYLADEEKLVIRRMLEIIDDYR